MFCEIKSKISITKNDLPALTKRLVEIENACFEADMAWDENTFKRYIENDWILVLLKDDEGNIQGYCGIKDKGHNHFHIVSIAVNPSFRGSNAGLKMMTQLIQEKAGGKPYEIILQCQPYLENYYKKCGFKVSAPPKSNYYHFKRGKKTIAVPGIVMSTNQLAPFLTKIKISNGEHNAVSLEQEKELLNTLIDFVSQIERSTSIWYKSFFHSARKELSLKSIRQQLIQMKESSIPRPALHLEGITKAVVSNALVIRKDFFHKFFDYFRKIISHPTNSNTAETSSGQMALRLLNTEKFSVLKKYISSVEQPVNYNALIEFSSRKNNEPHSESEYPYIHFSA